MRSFARSRRGRQSRSLCLQRLRVAGSGVDEPRRWTVQVHPRRGHSDHESILDGRRHRRHRPRWRRRHPRPRHAQPRSPPASGADRQWQGSDGRRQFGARPSDAQHPAAEPRRRILRRDRPTGRCARLRVVVDAPVSRRGSGRLRRPAGLQRQFTGCPERGLRPRGGKPQKQSEPFPPGETPTEGPIPPIRHTELRIPKHRPIRIRRGGPSLGVRCGRNLPWNGGGRPRWRRRPRCGAQPTRRTRCRVTQRFARHSPGSAAERAEGQQPGYWRQGLLPGRARVPEPVHHLRR